MAESASSQINNTYCDKDLSLVPEELTFGFIENYVKNTTACSGKEYMSKGVKYYSENYIHDIKGKYKYIHTLHIIYIQFCNTSLIL